MRRAPARAGSAWPKAPIARARESVTLARQLGDPFSLAYALFFETAVHWWRRDIAAQRQRATEVVALCETQGFPYWLGLGRAVHAGARVVAGDAGALPEILDGMALVGEIGNQLGGPALFALLAEAQRAAGQLAEAQAPSRPPWPSPHRRASSSSTPTSRA